MSAGVWLPTVTVAVCATAVAPIVAEMVVTSAIVDVTVPVVTPLELVVAAGCPSTLMLPVWARTTVAPLIGFPLASFAVTVIVDVAPPGAIAIGEAETVDWLADTGTGVTVTVAVWVIDVPLILAEIVFASATVEARVPVARPLPSVGPAGCDSVFPVPVAASSTVAPLTGRLFASLAVTVIVAVALPAWICDSA